ncbi:MAG: antibiotic biosynthesis monooxygenase [Akkermansiaceae bacterium]|nr:antibiotic biosynthesis monooxygenase [Akkermansiaceae bacterium]
MIAIVVTFEIHPGTETEALAALEANAAGSRTEPGCLKWEWSRHLEDPLKFAIYELYADSAAVDAHKSSPHFFAWLDAGEVFLKTKVSALYDVAGKDPRPVP